MWVRRACAVFGAWVFATCFVGCGGSDDAAGGSSSGLSCTREECRGDITGAWTIEGSCADKFEVVDDQTGCPEWICRVVELTAEGTLNFDANGAADVKFSTNMKSECDVPKSCLADDGHESCESYASSPGLTQKTCTDAGDFCKCTESSADSTDIVGTWEIQNETFLSIKTSNGMSGGMDWCVKNGELRMSWLRPGNSASATMHAILIAR